ncbi:hypothetical protein H9W84_08610 [Moraxella sp. PS-22]|uniref:Lipoprotein n=1 Tax=Moraxella tetraodonis TaxID=2767221 RepID=A0A9X2A4E9_9GAMM|nr:hypothetical protein [Moraxella tetraodonis]MCG8148187.1 hypothetical protein [Moraxella tetraodonis]
MQNTLAKITMLSLVSALTLTACDKKTDSTDNAAAASAAESQAVPMSAAPADEKNSAAVTEANATVDAGPDATNASGAATTVDAMPASTEADAADDGGADNSAMDKITENDTVIDNAPASPNAPKASDDAAPAVGNQKVGQ